MANISSKDIQNKYNRLYLLLKDYLWPVEVVEDIADLEISIYQAFPNINSVRQKLAKFKNNIYDVYKDDEEIKSVLDDLSELVNTNEVQYLSVSTFKAI